MTLAAVSLDDKYAAWSGEVYITGTQALVRLPMMQHLRDKAAGLDTACLISGYRGSPLGNFDRALWQARPFLEKHGVLFQPGVNEDLAATALWGTQQVGLFPGARHDGVFAIWYGKGPGVDRTIDVFKHANNAGTAAHGGVLALAGDDHVCASSTTAHQSEFDFMAAAMPVLNPAGVQEFLDYGLHGWALSRFAGLWVGFICVAETVDSSAIVSVDPHRVTIATPDASSLPAGGLNIRWPDTPLDQEERLLEHKLDAARAYSRANRLDRAVIDGPGRRLGVVTTGKSYLDVRQALDDLGIDEAAARRLGLALYKVGMSWPLEPDGIRRFAGGLDEILVVEEKRGFIENQIKELLYNLPAAERPLVIGKCDENGRPLLRASGELEPGGVAQVLAGRLVRRGADDRIEARIAFLRASWNESAAAEPAAIERVPYFCSGCPHNTSTKVPEGSRALAGIGCHYMAQWMDRETATFTHMGGEGASWIGQAPFTETRHVFQNIGDGTYFHSGILAVRAAVAAGVNMTYKILYNDAVAMTGGQPMDGPLTVQRVTRQIQAEGVGRIAVVTDQPHKYPFDGQFADGVTIHQRDELDQVQRELREWEGVSAIVYDQMCATEKRRRRKRGLLEDPDWRVIINPDVCEGCGDCGVQSNCLSVMPLETEFGRKRTIDQSACNKDFSCLKGFCPSFVLVKGGRPRGGRAPSSIGERLMSALPEPVRPACAEPYGILLAGVGGTGIVTLGALLGTAARLEGKGATVLDKAGLAQKYGAVTSHVRIAERPEDLHAVRIAAGGARLLLGIDLVVAASREAVLRLDRRSSCAVINGSRMPTGDFTRAPDFAFPADQLEQVIAAAASGIDVVDATRLATTLIGDAVYTNLFLLGLAYQRGLIPLGADALERAIALNGVAVDANLSAFRWGRAAAHDPEAVAAAAGAARETPAPEGLDALIERRAADLTAYQNAAYAARYRALVERVREAERARAPGRQGLSEAVARAYHKLLAYKDEYEVARLFTDGRFRRQVDAQFGGAASLRFSLAPPLFAGRDPETGHLKKRVYGPWILTAFRLLAALKSLRGTALDPFGYTAERRRERALIGAYEATVETLIAGLESDNHALAAEIAEVPLAMRGFGHVKEANIACAEEREAQLLAAYRAPTPPGQRRGIAALRQSPGERPSI